MQDAGILDGDLLVVHKTDDARSGQIVVARLGEEVTVKRLKRRGREITLVAENAAFAPIVVDPKKTSVRHRRRGGGRDPAQPVVLICIIARGMRMANVRYLVHDVDAALAFYTGPLGFELAERWGPPFAMVRRGDLTLWLSGPGTSAQRPMPTARSRCRAAGTASCWKWTTSTRRSPRCRRPSAQRHRQRSGGRQLRRDPSGNPVSRQRRCSRRAADPFRPPSSGLTVRSRRLFPDRKAFPMNS